MEIRYVTPEAAVIKARRELKRGQDPVKVQRVLADAIRMEFDTLITMEIIDARSEWWDVREEGVSARNIVRDLLAMNRDIIERAAREMVDFLSKSDDFNAMYNSRFMGRRLRVTPREWRKHV